MTNRYDDIDTLLKRNLSSTESPDPVLVQRIKCKFTNDEHIKNEEKHMRQRYKQPVIAVAVLIAALFITGTAFAAVTLWNQQQAELRKFLNIEGKDIPEYIEFNATDTVAIPGNDLNAAASEPSATATELNVAVSEPSAEDKGIPSYAELNDSDAVSIPNNSLNTAVSEPNAEGKGMPGYAKLNEADSEPIAVGSINVKLLSSMQDRQFIRYFISVSPVTLEQAENYVWYVRREGMFGWRFARWVTDFDKSYEKSSQSLLLVFSFLIGEHMDLDEDETEPFIATLVGEDMRSTAEVRKSLSEEYKKSIATVGIDIETNPPPGISKFRELVPEAFISTDFTIVPSMIDIGTFSISFGDGIEFKNPKTGETGLILGAEVNSGSVVWIYSYPAAETYFANGDVSSNYVSEEAAWCNGFEDAIRNSVIIMSDGSSINELVPNSTVFKDGILKSYAHMEYPIELSAVEGILVYPGKGLDHE